MPGSFDPYLGFGFRIFVDFLFTQSISRLALVALWALVAMLLADIAPNVWRDSGLRHIYHQVRKDVRHVKRTVPRIRIKNDLPSVRLFNQSRSTSVEVPSSIRSDIATPSRSTAPSRAPTPGPARRPGRSPPGTFPDVSGWSETGTDLSTSRDPSTTHPAPSPSLIPSREHAASEYLDNSHVTTAQTRTATVENTTVAITQTQHESVSIVVAATPSPVAASKSLEPVDDSLRLDPPTIPDDWVDVNHPTPAPANEPVVPKPDPESTPKPKPGPSTPVPSPPASVLPPPTVIDVSIDPPDMDIDNRASQISQLPDQIPLPESRAASVIGGVYDQPQPRSAVHDSLRSRVDKATSEIGIDPGKSLAQPMMKQKTTSQSSLRSWTGFFSRPKQDADAPEPPPKETSGDSADKGKLVVGGAASGTEPQIPTPAQVDPPANILTQPGIKSPLLLARVDPPKDQEQPKTSKVDQPPPSAGVDMTPPLQGGAGTGNTAGLRKGSLFDLPSPSRSPPPPFTEFAVPEGEIVEETRTPAQGDPVIQDEPPTELTAEQKAAEEKRMAFLLTQMQDLERSLADLQGKLDMEDDENVAKSIKSDFEDEGKTLKDVKARMARKKFSGKSCFLPLEDGC